jgi:hypothetical protein
MGSYGERKKRPAGGEETTYGRGGNIQGIKRPGEELTVTPIFEGHNIGTTIGNYISLM